MRWIALAGAAVGLTMSTAAEAQYYPYPPPAYYPPPPRYYRPPPPDYYPPPPPRYYRGQPRGYYPGEYGDSRQPLGAVVRGDGHGEPWRPRFDPRNGGYYCIQAGFTVQDGVCKPGRPY